MKRARFEALEPALERLDARVRELARSTEQHPPDTQLKRYTPAEQVVARVELSGPERRLSSVHAGIDVHGDGSTEAYLGRVRRKPLDRQNGEDGLAALRRALLQE